MPAAVAGLLAAGAIVLTGVLTMEQTYRAIAWTTVILVGGMLSLSTAMIETGAAAQLAERLVDVVGDAGPHALLLGLFLLTAVLGQLISNMATALIVIPIAISAAADMDVSAKPVLMTVAVVGGGRVPDPRCHAGEPHGDGSRRVPVRGLLEARPAAARFLRRGRRPPRAGVLVAVRPTTPIGLRRMHVFAASLGLLLALGLAAGCGDDEAEADEVAIVGVPWLLSSGLETAGWEEAPPSVTFTIDTVGGFSGCNRYTAPYTLDGDALEIGQVAMTQMACPPPADAVEREYLAAFGRVTGLRVDDDGARLVLLDDDDAELLRFGQASPVGDWEVTAFLTGNAVSSPVPGTTITASFAADGTLTGSAGCNTYRSDFTTNQGDIEIGSPSSTKKLCPAPEGVMGQEAAYLAAIPTAVRYRVDGSSLALLSADGTYVASYQRVSQP